MQLSTQVLSLSMQILTDNIDYSKRQHYLEVYKSTGAFNGDIRNEVVSNLRRFIPDSMLPDGLWDGWWNQVLLTWLGLPAPVIARQTTGGCSGCGR